MRKLGTMIVVLVSFFDGFGCFRLIVARLDFVGFCEWMKKEKGSDHNHDWSTCDSCTREPVLTLIPGPSRPNTLMRDEGARILLGQFSSRLEAFCQNDCIGNTTPSKMNSQSEGNRKCPIKNLFYST